MSPPDRPEIPITDLWAEHEPIWDELQAAAADVLRSGRYILGPNVQAFEREVAAHVGVAHGIGVNSGTDALVIGLRAIGVEPGDEVITTPFTFFATAEAIGAVGAIPVFADIEPRTFNLDPDHAASLVTERTRAIVPVHMFGHPAAMDRFVALADRHDLVVLEDNAQAMGATFAGTETGALGHAAAFSFFPSKTLGGFGDGGMVTTDDADVAAAARMLRAHGASRKYHNEVLGYNSRLDEIQAALLRVKLAHFDAAIAGRRRVAARYDEAIAGTEGVTVTSVSEGCEPAYCYYTIRILDGRRDTVAASLTEAGVATMVYYPVPVHRLAVYGDGGPSLPVAELAATEVLSLPIWPTMDGSAIDRVIDALEAALA